MLEWLKEFWNDWISLEDIELLDEAYMELHIDEKLHHGEF